MKKRKYNSALWKFLSDYQIYDPLHEDFKKYKAEFYRAYDKELKRKKRSENRTYIISFPVNRLPLLERTARTADIPVPDFIKLSVLSAIDSTSFEQRIPLYAAIQQRLDICLSAIEQLSTKNTGWMRSTRNYERLMQIIEELQTTIEQLTKTS